MTSSSERKAFPNVPPPAGSKPASAYARFIPREELGSFASWQPGALGGEGVERRAQPRPEGAPLPTPDEWRRKIAEARQGGYQDGYRDGLVALDSFKQTFAAQTTAQVGALLAAIDEQFAALEAQMAHAIARSAVLLARSVVRRELATEPEHVVPLAQEAVNAVLMSARQIVVRVHPDDHPLVEAGAAEVLRARGARLVADLGVQRGGCLIDSDAGTVDATIATRWAQAAAALGGDTQWPGLGSGASSAAPAPAEDTAPCAPWDRAGPKAAP
jgi:flagellar assembly protein FliH